MKAFLSNSIKVFEQNTKALTSWSKKNRLLKGTLLIAIIGSLIFWQILPAQASTQGNLVGYWKLDSASGSPLTTVDSSDNGNVGTLRGDASISGSTKPSLQFTNGGSMHLSGTGYMEGPATSSFGISGSMTFSAWINPTSVTSSSPQVIMSTSDGAGGAILEMSGSSSIGSCSASSLCFIAYVGGSPVVAQEALSNLTAGSWQQVNGTYDGANVNLYVAGIKVQATSATGPIANSAGGTTFCVGTSATASGCSTAATTNFIGSIDEVRVYNRALSNAESSQLSGGNDTVATWNGSQSTDFNNPANWDINAIPDAYTDIVVPSYAARDLDMTSNVAIANFTINAGTHGKVHLYGYNLTMNNGGKFSNNGNLYLNGTQTMTNFADDTYNHSPGSYYNNGTVTYTLGGALTSLPGGYNYMNLAFTGSGSVTLPSDLSVDTQGYSTINIGSGTALDLNGHNLNADNVTIGTTGVLDGRSGTITLEDEGTWANSGGGSGFVAGTSTVNANIGGSFNGNTTFYNFTSTNSDWTLTFQAGSTQTVTHNLSLTGNGDASTVYDRLSLRSSSTGTPWNINATGATTTLGYLDVKDSNNTSTQKLVAGYSVNSGDNTNWLFINPAISNLGPTAYVNDSWVHDSTPTLTLDAESGDSSIDVKYEIQIAGNSGFTSPAVDYTSALAAPGVTSYTPGSALANGNYYWRVRAINDGGMVSDWLYANSDFEAFKLDGTAPATPTVNIPAGSYNATQTPAVSSSDTGGSGFDTMYYTTDGTDPSDSHGTAIGINGLVSITSTATLKVIAYDNAGGSSAIKTVNYIIDETNPTNPTMSPVGGWYTSAPSVTLSATDSGGSNLDGIYYTTNGSTPSNGSTKYTTPIATTNSETIKAIAYDNAGNTSSVISATYNIDTTAPTNPTFGVSAGSYKNSQSVTLSSTDSGGSGLAAIYYTTDNSTPSSGSTLYSGAITVSSSETIKAIAYDVAGNTSSVTSAAYIIDTVAPANPNLSPAAGSYSTTQTVTVTSSDSGGSSLKGIYYTTDGSTPDQTSTRLSSGDTISVSANENIKAIAYDNAGNASSVVTANYIIDGVAPNTPVANPAGGHYSSSQSVQLTATDTVGGSGISAIYYTIDNSTPSSGSTLYTGAISVPNTGPLTIKAIAYDNVGHASSVMSESYDFDTTAPTTPVLSIPAGDYNANQTVALTSSDTGGSGLGNLYYTTDGSAPTKTNGTAITSGSTITVSTNETVKAIAYDNAGNASAVASNAYIIDTAAPSVPTATPPAGYYNAAQSVVLSSSDSGGSSLKDVYYTTNGSTPNCSSTAYTTPIAISSSETIKAIACDNAGNSSTVATFSYDFDTTAPTTPVLSIPAGAYNANQIVTLTSSDTGGSGLGNLYYTTDGSAPTKTNGTGIASGATVTISSNVTLKAIAYDGANNTSAVASAAYIIDKTAPSSLAADPVAGSYMTNQLVTLSASDTGGSGLDKMYFTTDGTAPSSSSTAYTGAFTVSSSQTVKMIAYDNVGNASSVVSIAYIIDKVAPSDPGFSVSGGNYSTTQSVVVTATDAGGSNLKGIYYTTDGSAPSSTHGTQIASGTTLTVNASKTIKAIAYDNAGNASAVVSNTYVIDGTNPGTPVLSLSSGWYHSDQSLTITATDAGGSNLKGIYYTTDGSAPSSTHGTQIASGDQVSVTSNETVKAIAYDNANNLSSIVTATYSFDRTAPSEPSISPDAGYYNKTQTAVLDATDTGGSGLTGIYYTLDGSTPSSSSTLYTSPISITTSKTVEAIAYDNAGNVSGILNVSYTIDVVPPIGTAVSPNNEDTNVSISSKLGITFSKLVNIGSGSITIYKSSDNSVVEDIPVSSGQVSGGGTPQITVTLSNKFDYNTQYYVLVSDTAFQDKAGNYYAGVSSPSAWSFTTELSAAQIATNKIEAYKNSGGKTAVPTAADYQAAGISGVTSDNLDVVNNSIASSDNIQALASIGASSVKLPETIQKIVYKDSPAVATPEPVVITQNVPGKTETKIVHDQPSSGSTLLSKWWWIPALLALVLGFLVPNPFAKKKRVNLPKQG